MAVIEKNFNSLSGRQMIPGLLLIGSNQAVKLEQPPPPKEQTLDTNVEPSRTTQPSKVSKIWTIFSLCLVPSFKMVMFLQTSKGLRPELRLKYLAQVLEYEVEFSDFPKVYTVVPYLKFPYSKLCNNLFSVFIEQKGGFRQYCDFEHRPSSSFTWFRRYYGRSS